jgi:hypothetical protein
VLRLRIRRPAPRPQRIAMADASDDHASVGCTPRI